MIVGAGPTGLTIANLLGRYGVRTLLVERNETTVQAPRAVSIDDESLRTLQAVGIDREVCARTVSGYGSEYFTPSGRLFLKVAPAAAPYGYPRRNAFRQPVLEDQLRRHLAAYPTVEALFGWSLETFDQDEDGVQLRLTGCHGRVRDVACGYVVAADGASSPIREHLGLGLKGESFSEKWLIVDLDASPAPSTETMVFCDWRRPCIALPGPDGTRRFEFKLLPGDDPERMTDEVVVNRLLAAHGAHAASRVLRKVVYGFHARLASTWSKGRVFLAGDACHLTPPFAGQGMNSGLRDAHNLAWKLAWTMRGALSPAVLKSYQAERRPHVAEMIRLALRMGRIMGPRSWLHGAATQAVFRLLGLVPAVRNYFGQMKYKPKPRFSAGFLIPDGRPRRRTSVGRLLPQPWVMHDDGRVDRLDSALGDGFALLAFGDVADLLKRAVEEPALAELQLVLVQAVETGETRPPALGVRTVVDTHGLLRAGLDRPFGRAFLIRPDRYVMAAFSLEQAASFSDRLAALPGVRRPGQSVAPSRARQAAT